MSRRLGSDATGHLHETKMCVFRAGQELQPSARLHQHPIPAERAMEVPFVVTAVETGERAQGRVAERVRQDGSD